MITICSKELPGSIVTKTLKNGILIPIFTSKESHFNADFKYTVLKSRVERNFTLKFFTVLKRRIERKSQILA